MFGNYSKTKGGSAELLTWNDIAPSTEQFEEWKKKNNESIRIHVRGNKMKKSEGRCEGKRMNVSDNQSSNVKSFVIRVFRNLQTIIKNV